jgi:hypothetical protein
LARFAIFYIENDFLAQLREIAPYFWRDGVNFAAKSAAPRTPGVLTQPQLVRIAR